LMAKHLIRGAVLLIHERHEALGVRCQTCEYLATKRADGADREFALQ
jgi:hypothetical protein